MYGDWDLISPDVTEHSQFKGYEEFKNGDRDFYKPNIRWDVLYKSIKENGYNQNPNGDYVTIAIGRDGTLFSVDGLHRVIIARDLGIKAIPVKIKYIHSDYDFGKLNLVRDKIIPEFFYELVKDKWCKDKEVYQKHSWMNGRLNAIKYYLPMLKGCDVLDVGCNAFITSWSIMANGANSLVGIEQGEKWCDNGKITVECLKSKWGDKRVEIVNEFFKDYILKGGKKFNAFFGMCIMYWFTDEDLKILQDRVLPKCKKIIVSSRLSKNKYSNAYDFYKEENLIRFFTDNGFVIKSRREGGIVYVAGERKG